MWIYGEIAMTFNRRLCGSVPLKKEIVESWLTARMPKRKPQEGKSIEEIETEVLESIEDIEEKVTLGFQENEKGLFVRSGTIKAHVKDSANQIKDVIKPPVKNFRGKVANKFYIDEYHVYLKRNDDFIQSEDGEFDQPVHVITRQGPRSALKIIQFLNQPSLQFHCKLMIDKEVIPENIEQVFEYGSIHGYGGERGMGEGRYSYQINWKEK